LSLLPNACTLILNDVVSYTENRLKIFGFQTAFHPAFKSLLEVRRVVAWIVDIFTGIKTRFWC
jgi:hypothetical protein